MSEQEEQPEDVEPDSDEELLEDVTVTAEFDYDSDLEELAKESEDDSDDDDEPKIGESVPQSGVNPGAAKKLKKSDNQDESNPSADDLDDDSGELTKALDDFDALLDEEVDGGNGSAGGPDSSDAPLGGMPADPGSMPGPNLESSNQSGSGAAGFDEPQVSGVFSRYDEETSAHEEEDFDLFEDSEEEEQRERTLQEIVNAHEKEVRRLRRQVDYQKQVLQTMSDLLVEARVISRRELKKRLKKLRRDNS